MAVSSILVFQVSADLDGPSPWGRDCSIASNDLVFWMGDLNYRLNMPDALVSYGLK